MTAIALTVVIVTAVLANVYSFLLLVLLIDVLTLREFYRLFSPHSSSPRNWLGIILSVSILTSFSLVLLNLTDSRVILINIPMCFLIFVAELYLRSEHPIHNLAFNFLGNIWITLPLCFFISIGFMISQSQTYHPYFVLSCFLLPWAGDTGAYIIGSLFGTHSLFKRISPKKTWEGSLGGLTSTLFVAYLISQFEYSVDKMGWFLIAVIITVAGSFGDLVKSMMKRSLQLKDSGSILPGHGGMLDRFDTLLASAPFIFAYLLILRYA